MTSPDERPTTSAARRSFPALLLLVVSVLELASGTDAVVLSLVVISPLVAASSLSARATAAYAVLALLTGAALGVPAQQYEADQVVTQAIRLCTVAAASALAVVGADLRTKRETRLAQVLRGAAAQQAVLPPLPERLGPLALAASYDSAAAEAAVGGDTYAAELTADHGVRLLIADVRGHGLEAVRLAATVLGAFRERAHEASDVGVLAAALDRSVSRAGSDEDFVTAVVAQVSDGVLSIANAGHAPPLLLRDGSVTPLRCTAESPPLGLGADPVLCTVPLSPGDRLVLFTDGATEARRADDGAFFGFEDAAAGCLAAGPLREGLAQLRTALVDWTGSGLHDDVTVLVAEHRP